MQTARPEKECDWRGESFRDVCPEGRVRPSCTGESKVLEEGEMGEECSRLREPSARIFLRTKIS